MQCVRFLPKTVIVFFGKKRKYDCKDNHRYGKSANFWPDNMSKIDYKMLVMI